MRGGAVMQLDLGLAGSTFLEPMCHGFGMVVGSAHGGPCHAGSGGPLQKHAVASPQVSCRSASRGATL